ncbi:MAG: alpha/beta hydrolase [Chloroflexi bacterium]|nr:alpha/beta hydrolase [Chloroflexota bacterium]
MQVDKTEIVKDYRPMAELVPVHWQNGAIEVTDGARIHYTRTGGAKPVVLLLHGLQGNGLMWLRTARALAATYDVIMPDFRGHGQSSRVTTNWSAQMLVEDMIELIHTLGLDQPYVVGHSLGADIAGRVAAVVPVRAVVLVDPALRNVAAALAIDPDNPPPWMLAFMEMLQALKEQTHEQRLQTGLRLIPPGAPVWDEEDYVSFVEAEAQFDLKLHRYTSSMDYLCEMPEVIAHITCPLLLLTAHPGMPGLDIDELVAVWQQHWQNGQHIHFPDSGHFIAAEQFDRFIDVLTRFLSEH